MFNYQIHADNGSMYNTPPTYAIYICKMVLEWIRDEMGGLEKMKEYNQKKAAILYDFLDSSNLFKGTVVKEDRSMMNVPLSPATRTWIKSSSPKPRRLDLSTSRATVLLAVCVLPSTTPCPSKALRSWLLS